jgi:Flp pilus assembly protein TadB
MPSLAACGGLLAAAIVAPVPVPVLALGIVLAALLAPPARSLVAARRLRRLRRALARLPETPHPLGL